MTVRPAREADLPAIARVHVDSWRSTYAGVVPADLLAALSYAGREEMWRSVVTDPSRPTFLYVAESGGAGVVGFAAAGPERSGDEEYQGELYAIYVLDAYQGRGLGRQLITAAARELAAREMHSLLVWVLAQNPGARAFYEPWAASWPASMKSR